MKKKIAIIGIIAALVAVVSWALSSKNDWTLDFHTKKREA
jgi:hypothetical protein